MKKFLSLLLVVLNIVMICSCGNSTHVVFDKSIPSESLELGKTYIIEDFAEIKVKKIITTNAVSTMNFNNMVVDVILDYKNLTDDVIEFSSLVTNEEDSKDFDSLKIIAVTAEGDRTYEAVCYSEEKGLTSTSVSSSASIGVGQEKELHFIIEMNEEEIEMIDIILGFGDKKYEYSNYSLYDTVIDPNIEIMDIYPDQIFEVSGYGMFNFWGTIVSNEMSTPIGKIKHYAPSGKKYVISGFTYCCKRSDFINSNSVIKVTATSEDGRKVYQSEYYADPNDNITPYSLTQNIEMTDGSIAQMYVATEVPASLTGSIKLQYEIGDKIFTYTAEVY